MPLPHRAYHPGLTIQGSPVSQNKQASKQARRSMPRKQIIKRKVRRLTPREINFLVKGVVAFEMEIETDPLSVEDHHLKEQDALQGIYKHLAIIVDD
tara:strand:- start:2727 stop:3017 length:291 start_codon:yes stop_codon:yes gene_type:complete